MIGFDAVMKLFDAASATISANTVGSPPAASARLIAIGTITMVAPTWLITSENAVVSNASAPCRIQSGNPAGSSSSVCPAIQAAAPLLSIAQPSGAASWVAGNSVEQLPDGTPNWVLQLVLGLLTTLFSLVISHVGATIVMVPLAVNLALAVGGSPTAFALIVALSASNNFMTASNPVISMITGPAGYSGKELWRVGGPLSLIYTGIAVLMVNLLF